MQALLKNIFNYLREDLGYYPASLLQMFIEHPQIRVSLDEPTLCIDAQSVPSWHELGTYPLQDFPHRNRGQLLGWKAAADGHWQSFVIERPEYAQIGHCEITTDWFCDITDVHGFSASKSELRDFAHTDEMVETNSKAMIDPITTAKLADNLAHSEIRIIHNRDTSDHFARYLWDGRLWLMNTGGSHHMAAAKYIAARLGQPVALTGKLNTYSLNAVAIASLRRDFEMFVISDEARVANAFSDAMRAFRATWLWHSMLRPYEHTRTILLPKSEARSMRVAAEFRKAGVLDFGAYLTRLANRQVQHRSTTGC